MENASVGWCAERVPCKLRISNERLQFLGGPGRGVWSLTSPRLGVRTCRWTYLMKTASSYSPIPRRKPSSKSSATSIPTVDFLISERIDRISCPNLFELLSQNWNEILSFHRSTEARFPKSACSFENKIGISSLWTSTSLRSGSRRLSRQLKGRRGGSFECDVMRTGLARTTVAMNTPEVSSTVGCRAYSNIVRGRTPRPNPTSQIRAEGCTSQIAPQQCCVG